MVFQSKTYEREMMMPIIRVEMLSGRSHQQKQEIAKLFTQELARIAKCQVTDVQVVFNEVDKLNWAVGGILSSDLHKVSSDKAASNS